MPGRHDVGVLDDDILHSYYDPGSIGRGRVYAADDRVRLLGTSPSTIHSVCRGSGGASYIVHVRWLERAGEVVDLDDECTCPLGGACKHCVATILTAVGAARTGTARATAEATGPRRRGDWRRVLSGLPSDDGEEREAGVPLALQFELSRPGPSRYSAFTAPQVFLRPLRRGKRGGWVKTRASWRDLAGSYGPGPGDVDPRQLAALRGLVDGARDIVAYAYTQPIALKALDSDVWRRLALAVEAGITLVDHDATTPVELAPTPAHVEVDLTADDSGDVVVATTIALADERFVPDDETVGLIGDPPHGVWVLDGGRLRLVPLTGVVHSSLASMVGSEALVVPAEEVDELLEVYQPVLARHATVGSSDGSVTIVERRFDGLALTVERTALDTAELRWSARYRRGERVTDLPLHGLGRGDRDRTAEADAVAALELPTHLLAGLVGADGSPIDTTASGPAAVALFSEVLPWLEAKCDVAVDVVGDQPELTEAVGDPLISLTVADSRDRRDGNDWFDLGVEVSIDGEIVDFVSLFTALAHDDEVLILPSGTWLRLDRPELVRLRDLIEEARALAEPDGDGVARVNRFQGSWFDDLAALGVVASQSRRWEESVDALASLTTPEPVDPPAGLAADLRPYQREGLDWLAFLHRHRLGGILADDMGLGKTVQTLALCLHVRERRPDARFLVVAPTSVVENWAREAARFAPDLAVQTITQTEARRGTTLAMAIAEADLVVTSYALFRLEHDAYAAHDWEILLLDEAQFVKNHQGKTYQCVRRLEAATKIAMTGTPLENTLMDLWSLLSITAPGLYPDPKRFSDTYRKPIEAGDAPELLATLQRRIAPLMRRRTKDAVLSDLPPKTEQTIDVALSPRHARIYSTQLQRQRQKILGLVDDVDRHRFEILKSLTLLRQLALDPGLVDDAHADVGSAKLDRLIDDITQVVAEGHRALVFSQFTRFLAKMRTRLDAAGIGHSYLDGRTRKRAEAISRFKDSDIPVFVISLKAGGFGLNLTEADYCFVLDPWWNPATETQAVDRTHRIGQENPVVVYRYVSTDTIEEKVMELKGKKAELFANVMDADGGALAGALTESDIRGLLDLG